VKQRKNEQLSGLIRMHLAEIISREMSDPRTDSVVVTRVELSSDGSFARIFISSLEDGGGETSDTMKSLIRASGFIRKHLSGRMGTRTVPTLRFVWDDSVRRGEEVLSLLRSLDTGVNGS